MRKKFKSNKFRKTQNLSKSSKTIKMEIEIEKLRFSLNEEDLTASVIKSPKATGNVFIPRFIKHESKKYKIISLKVNSFSENRIESLTFDENSEVTTFEGYSFLKTYITKLQIPANLKKIDDCCFENVYNLVYIDISPKNKNFIYKNNEFLLGKSQEKSDIFDLLYYARFDIKKAIIPAEVRILKMNSFRFHKVKSIIFPENSELQCIQDFAISQSTIQKLVLPSKVDSIDGKNFNSIDSLINVIVSPQNQFFYYAENKFLLKKSSPESQCFDVLVFCRRNAKKVVIPSNIKEISTNAFNNCKRLISVRFDLNSSLQTINNYAFACCFGIKRIVFPESVKRVGNSAFFLITNLRLITFLGKSVVMQMKCFSSCKSLEAISFPNANRLIFGDKSISDVPDEMIIRVKHETQILGSGAEECMNHVRYYDDYTLDLKEDEEEEEKESSIINEDLVDEFEEEEEEANDENIVKMTKSNAELVLNQEDKKEKILKEDKDENENKFEDEKVEFEDIKIEDENKTEEEEVEDKKIEKERVKNKDENKFEKEVEFEDEHKKTDIIENENKAEEDEIKKISKDFKNKIEEKKDSSDIISKEDELENKDAVKADVNEENKEININYDDVHENANYSLNLIIENENELNYQEKSVNIHDNIHSTNNRNLNKENKQNYEEPCQTKTNTLLNNDENQFIVKERKTDSPSDLPTNQERIEEIINECLISKDAKKLMKFLNDLHDNEVVSQVFDRFYYDLPEFYSELCKEGISLNNCVAHEKYSIFLIFNPSNQKSALDKRENYEKARFHLEESIRLGFDKSYFLLARLLHECFKQDKKAFEVAQEGSKKGEKFSKCILGHFIANGIGIEKDHQKGIKLMLESGAESYYILFSTDIGLYYINLGDEKKKELSQLNENEDQFNESLYEYKEAFKWFTTAFEMRKSNVTINNLGICLIKGIGTKKNYSKAKEIFEFGIEKGDTNSKYHMGFILEETEPEKSYKYYKEAAYEGHYYAQIKYANIEKEDNPDEAEKFFKIAAEKGHLNSQTLLASTMKDSDENLSNLNLSDEISRNSHQELVKKFSAYKYKK